MSAPTHPGLLEVVRNGKEGEYLSKAISLQDFEPGAVFAKITGATPTGNRTYATVQTGRSSDIDLNTDLVFCNHSCDPSVVFDMHKMEVRVIADRPLKAGQDVTFFYPSSEWDMQQPFDCFCGSPKCVGRIRGARYLEDDVLDRYWLNPHIEELVGEREQASVNGAVKVNGEAHVNGQALTS